MRIVIANRNLETAHEDLAASIVEAYDSDEISWTDIGFVLGISRQAAHERFRHLTDTP